MAPGITETTPTPPHQLQVPTLKKNPFPDGLKTSGQHPPIYSALRPYNDFPKEISGPTVWKTEDYRDNPERWTHPFSWEEIAELSTAADKFIAAGTPLTGISKVRTITNRLGVLLPRFLSFGLQLMTQRAGSLPPP
jgi:hypothetical protein